MAGDVDQRDRGATSEILLSSSAAQSLTTVLLSSSWLFSNNPLQPSLYSSTLLTQRTTLQGWFLDVIKYICSICISLPVWHERLFGGGLRSAQEAVDRMMYIHEFIHDFFFEKIREEELTHFNWVESCQGNGKIRHESFVGAPKWSTSTVFGFTQLRIKVLCQFKGFWTFAWFVSLSLEFTFWFMHFPWPSLLNLLKWQEASFSY